jgi:hypothetical protein
MGKLTLLTLWVTWLGQVMDMLKFLARDSTEIIHNKSDLQLIEVAVLGA